MLKIALFLSSLFFALAGAQTTIVDIGFTGTNGTSLPTFNASFYNCYGGMEIQSNRAAGSTTGGGAVDMVGYTGAWTADQWVEVVITPAGGANFVGAAFRVGAAATGNGYYCVTYGGGSTYFGKIESGSRTFIQEGFANFLTGDTMRVEVHGTTFTFYKNGVLYDTATDATYSSGAAGVAGVGNSASVGTASLSHFKAGTFASPSRWGAFGDNDIFMLKLGF